LKGAEISESLAGTIDLLGVLKKSREKTTWFIHFIGLPGFLLFFLVCNYWLSFWKVVFDTK
jgi:hypothetical protein